MATVILSQKAFESSVYIGSALGVILLVAWFVFTIGRAAILRVAVAFYYKVLCALTKIKIRRLEMKVRRLRARSHSSRSLFMDGE